MVRTQAITILEATFHLIAFIFFAIPTQEIDPVIA